MDQQSGRGRGCPVSVFAEFSTPSISCPFERELASYSTTSLEFEQVVPTDGDSQYIWVVGTQRDALLSAMQSNPDVETLVLVDELPGRTLVRARWALTENPVFRLLAGVNATLIDAVGTNEGWVLSLRFLDPEGISSFYTDCVAQGIDLTLRQVHTATNPGDTPYYGLSSKQVDTVVDAFQRGYFRVPRDVTTEQLAARLGVSSQAVSERMRRGIATLVATTLLDDGTDSEPEE